MLNLVKSQEGDVTIYTSNGTRMTDPQQIIDEIGLDENKEYVSKKYAKAYEGQQKGPDGKPAILQMRSTGVEISRIMTKNQEIFLDAIQHITPPNWSTVEPMKTQGEVLGLLGIYDAHFGKLDTKGTSLSKQVKSVVTGAKQAIDKMCDRDVDKILMVRGGDTDNTDHAGKTTKGTEQEHNAKAIDVYKASNEAMMTLADYSGNLKETAIDILSGNHDEEKALFHRDLMTHLFKDNPNVEILQHDMDFNVVKHGDVGLLLHHGDKLKPKDIIQIINRYIKGVTCYVAHTGHSHTKFILNFGSATQMGHPSSGPKNGWSTNFNVGKDYHQMDSHIYDKKGLLESFTTRLK